MTWLLNAHDGRSRAKGSNTGGTNERARAQVLNKVTRYHGTQDSQYSQNYTVESSQSHHSRIGSLEGRQHGNLGGVCTSERKQRFMLD